MNGLEYWKLKAREVPILRKQMVVILAQLKQMQTTRSKDNQ